MKRSLIITVTTLVMIFALLLAASSLAYASISLPKSQGAEFAYSNKHQKPWITDKDAIRKHTDAITDGIANTFAKTHNQAAVEKYLKSQGLEAMPTSPVTSSNSTISPDGSNLSEVVFSQPYVYHDPSTGLYLLSGYWQWGQNSANGLPYWYYDYIFPGNVGGPDKAGFWVGNPKGITLTSNIYLVTYDLSNKSYTTTTAMDWNQYGAVFSAQDTSWGDPSTPCGQNYNWDSGQVMLWCSISGSGSTYLKTYLAHDFYAPEIGSVSIGLNGISCTIDDSTKAWQATSNPYMWTR